MPDVVCVISGQRSKGRDKNWLPGGCGGQADKQPGQTESSVSVRSEIGRASCRERVSSPV